MRKTGRHSGDGREAWPDDAQVQRAVRRAQQGEPGAVDALVVQLRPLFVRFFAREFDQDTADDLTQDALLRVLSALPRLDSRRASRYVARVARHRRRSASRQRARDARRFAPIEAARNVRSPVRADRQAEFADVVRAAASLPPRARACVLETLSGLSPADIAAAHGLSPTTVRRHLQRARAPLQAALGLSATAPPAPPALNVARPQVRETARFPYRIERFPELRSRGGRGGEFAVRADSGPRWVAHHAPGDDERAVRVREERTGSGACGKQPSHARAENASAR